MLSTEPAFPDGSPLSPLEAAIASSLDKVSLADVWPLNQAARDLKNGEGRQNGAALLRADTFVDFDELTGAGAGVVKLNDADDMPSLTQMVRDALERLSPPRKFEGNLSHPIDVLMHFIRTRRLQRMDEGVRLDGELLSEEDSCGDRLLAILQQKLRSELS